MIKKYCKKQLYQKWSTAGAIKRMKVQVKFGDENPDLPPDVALKIIQKLFDPDNIVDSLAEIVSLRAVNKELTRVLEKLPYKFINLFPARLLGYSEINALGKFLKSIGTDRRKTQYFEYAIGFVFEVKRGLFEGLFFDEQSPLHVRQLLLEHQPRVFFNDARPTTYKMARERDDVDMVKAFLDHGMPLEPQHLIIAIWEGKLGVAALFVERGAEVNFVGHARMTPLIAAVSRKHLDMARLLLDAGADVHDREEHALYLAVFNRDADTTRLLIRRGAIVNIQHIKEVLEEKYSTTGMDNLGPRKQVLELLLGARDVKFTRRDLDKLIVNPEFKPLLDAWGSEEAPLKRAKELLIGVKFGQDNPDLPADVAIKVIEQLIDPRDVAGSLAEITRKRQVDKAFKDLIDNHLPYTFVNLFPPLTMDEVNAFINFLDGLAIPSRLFKYFSIAVGDRAYKSTTEPYIRELLLRYRPRAFFNKYSVGDFVRVAEQGDTDMISAFLDVGMEPLHVNIALWAALRGRHKEAVELLLTKGKADPNDHAMGESVLEQAVGMKEVSIARILLDNGADVHDDEERALLIAVTTNNFDMVRLLLRRNAIPLVKHLIGALWRRSTQAPHGDYAAFLEMFKLLLSKRERFPFTREELDEIRAKTKDPAIIAMLDAHGTEEPELKRAKECMQCGAKNPQTIGSCCKAVAYCDQECADKHWSKHKHF